MSIGTLIRDARKAAGKTQAQLAHEVEVDVGTVSRWERGESVPPLPELLRIARATGRPLEAFVPPEDLPASGDGSN